MAKKQTSGNLALEQQHVIVIPAHDEIVACKLRVAAYARVSSSSEDQLNSYRVQNQYYSELISNTPDWEMVDIYADEGIAGTSIEKREDFQRMMRDCRKGKIDRILVKSISRFARNTKDCLAAVRELKELGVSVLFEEQGIDTARASSEMVTAIMAALAQKQSESISGNVQWSIQHQMEAGKYKLRTAPFGYTIQNGLLTVNEKEAPTVSYIFNAYEEIFITSFDGDVLGLYDHLGEYESIDELNHLAHVLSDLDQSDIEKFEAVIDSGEYTGSVHDLINLAQNLDCYDFYPGIDSEEALGRAYIEEMEMLDVPDNVLPYFDFEAYGRDARINDGGHFAPGGYVFNNGGKFVEQYHGMEDIPPEHRIFAYPKLNIREQMAAYQEVIDRSALNEEKQRLPASREDR